MNYPKYEHIETSGNGLTYEFTSIGPLKEIKKIIQYTPTVIPSLYNLGFGDLAEDGTISDNITSNNSDRDKVLATVVASAYEFTKHHPEATILFSGSTEARTRLYRRLLSLEYNELSKDFIISGITENGNPEPFVKNRNYIAFLAKRK